MHSAVDTLTRLGVEPSGVRFPAEARLLSKTSRPGSGDHRVSYSMGTMDSLYCRGDE